MKSDYTITSAKSFDAAVQAVEQATAAQGFRVLYVHDVQATFAEKGVAIEPYKIVEVCSVKYASRVLAANPLAGLLLPCKINVFVERGETKVTLLLPSLLVQFFPDAGLVGMAQEVEAILKRVVDSAR